MSDELRDWYAQGGEVPAASEEIPWIADTTTAPVKGLVDMAEEVINNNIARGWRRSSQDETRTIGDELMLIVTECAEAWRAVRAIRTLGVKGSKPLTYGEKLMDAVVELANGMEAYRAGDTARLTKPDDGLLEDELADILIRLIDTAYWRGIDLAEAYEKKMEFNRTRPYRHGDKRL